MCRHMAEPILGDRTCLAAVRTAGAGTACGMGMRPRCGVGPAGRTLSAALRAHFCGSAPSFASSREPAAYFIREADLPLCLKLEEAGLSARSPHAQPNRSKYSSSSSHQFTGFVCSLTRIAVHSCVCAQHTCFSSGGPVATRYEAKRQLPGTALGRAAQYAAQRTAAGPQFGARASSRRPL